MNTIAKANVWVLAAAGLLGWAAAMAEEEPAEPRRDAVHRAADAEGQVEEPQWKKDIREKLQRKVSFEFVETPLTEAITFLQTLTKVNFIIDPRAVEHRNPPITLKVQDMQLELALQWILRLAELEYKLRDQAILITQHIMGEEGDSLLKIYDVGDIAEVIADFPGPEMPPTGRLNEPAEEGVGAEGVIMGVEADGFNVQGMAEMIMTRIKPDSWAAELGTSIEQVGRKLVIMQRPYVHALIAKFLGELRRDKLQVRTDVRFCAVDEAALAKILAGEKPGAGTIFLKKPQIDALEKLLADGKAAKLVDSASLTCFNSQRAHVMAGKSFEKEAPGGGRGVYFRGIVLDARPVVSSDRKYVKTELRLTRVAGEEPPAPPDYFRLRTSLTCLDTDTVLLAGAALPGEPPRRLIALLSPAILRLEPPAKPDEKKPEEKKPEAPPAAPEAKAPQAGAARNPAPAAARPGAAPQAEVF